MAPTRPSSSRAGGRRPSTTRRTSRMASDSSSLDRVRSGSKRPGVVLQSLASEVELQAYPGQLRIETVVEVMADSPPLLLPRQDELFSAPPEIRRQPDRVHGSARRCDRSSSSRTPAPASARCRLDVDDVRLSAHTGARRVLGKGERVRQVPIHPKLAKALKGWLEGDVPLWPLAGACSAGTPASPHLGHSWPRPGGPGPRRRYPSPSRGGLRGG